MKLLLNRRYHRLITAIIVLFWFAVGSRAMAQNLNNPALTQIRTYLQNANIDEKMLIENEALILSMTKKEKENPKIISGSRRKRIAKGSGVDVSKINKLLKQFKMMSDMMKKMSQGKKIPSGMMPGEMLNQLK